MKKAKESFLKLELIKKMYINGAWVKSSDDEWIENYNPSNREILCRVPNSKKEDVNRAIESAKVAFESVEWKSYHPAERGRILHQVAQKIRERKEEIVLDVFGFLC